MYRNEIPVQHITSQDHLCQRILQCSLDHPFQRTRPEHRIIAFVGQPFARRVVQIQPDLTTSKSFEQTVHLDIDDPRHVATCKTVKDHRFIQTIQEFGAEVGPHRIHHIPFRLRHITRFRKLAQRLGTKVAGQHNQRLLEVDLAALTIG